MKRQIRRNVFETNSSSTHSICITKNDILDEKRNWITFYTGEFGWEHETLYSITSKASYLYTAILYLEKYGDYEGLLDKLKSILNENNIEYEFIEPENDWWYIDHCGNLIDFINDILNDESKLMRYLFSSDSFIITGNDNSGSDVDINVNYEHDEYYKGN